MHDTITEEYVSATDDFEETVMNGEDIKNQERTHNNDDPDMEEHVVDFENEERSQNDDDSDESTYDYQMERESYYRSDD